MYQIFRLYILIVALFLCSFAEPGFAVTQQQLIAISPAIALPIGVKIWFNECGGSINGLTSWNIGESFASLGIGHFIWYPFPGRATQEDGFPRLIKYMEAHNIAVPAWLHGKLGLYCPWHNREEFISSQNSERMRELRLFLQQTIPIQAQYMAHHLEQIIPKFLARVPPVERPYICQQFYTLARTPQGIYALIDYLNFKGPGIGSTTVQHKIDQGTGLLQVLEGMRLAPPNMVPMQAFVWSAKNALIRRVQNIPPQYHAERWLVGWFKRVNTYLD
jgi:hypothetical protein